MNWNDVIFCPDDCVKGLNVSAVVDALAGKDRVFPVGLSEVFLERYRKMREHFRDSCIKHPDFWKQGDLRLADVKRYRDALLEIPAAHSAFKSNDEWKEILKNPCVGHDLPVWMHGPKVCANRRIMIVSQDPLRKGHNVGKLLLSSPFGYHSAAYRGAKLIMGLALALMDEGCTLYFTDYTKIYSGPKEKIKLGEKEKCHCKDCVYITECFKKFYGYWQRKFAIKQQFASQYLNCLRQEIRLFKPAVVVLLGNDVLKLAAGQFSFEVSADEVRFVENDLPKMTYLGSPMIDKLPYRFYAICHPTGVHLAMNKEEKVRIFQAMIINTLTRNNNNEKQ